MVWLLILLAAFGGALGTYAQKALVTRMDPARVLLYNFAAVFAFVWVGVTVFRGVPTAASFDPRIGAIAAANVLAAYAYLVAIRAHVAKSVLLSPLSTAVSTLLGAALFHEWALLSPAEGDGMLRIVGIISAGAALVLFGRNNASAPAKDASGSWLFAAALAMVIWGVANTLIKVFSAEQVPQETFLFSWYSAAAASAALFFAVYRYGMHRMLQPTEKHPATLFLLLLLSALTVGSLWVFFIVSKSAPSVFLFPVHDMLKYGGSAVIGLIVFAERRGFTRNEWLGAACGAFSLLAFILTPLF